MDRAASAARYARRPLRSYYEYTGSRCCPANAQADRLARFGSSLGVCRDLCLWHGGGHRGTHDGERMAHTPRKCQDSDHDDEAFIASFLVCNPAVYGHTLGEISGMDESKFVVSRLWRDGKVILPNAQTRLQQNDRILVITQQRQVAQLTIYFGQRDETNWNRNDVDWNALDSKLISQRILITRANINGRHLGDLQLRNRYGVNVSRVQRSGIQLVATPNLTLRMGDRVTVVGEAESIKRVATELGNVVKRLDEPNMVTIFIGIVLGLLLGSIPLFVPGMSYPVRLGLAGGPIVMGILIGAFGPRLHMVAYTTTSANLMLRSLGLSTYLACLGLDAGKDFVATVMQPQALWWIGIALVITLVPVIVMSIVSVVCYKRSYATTAGMLCGAMANPIALEYVNAPCPTTTRLQWLMPPCILWVCFSE